MDVTPLQARDNAPTARETSTAGPTYVLSRWLFLRLLGVVYLIAFVSLALQVTGLIGEHGILPATTFLDRTRALYGGAAYSLFPTVCWLGAGGDRAWRPLTALDSHFWTQPLPPWTAWYAQQLPGWVHRGMTLGMFAIELGGPWLIFAPRRFPGLRVAACVLLVLGQFGIALTGNYGFFNQLAVVLCLALLEDATLRRVLRLRLAAGEAEPLWWRRVTATLAAVIAPLSALTVAREIGATLPGARGSGELAILRAIAPVRSINGYGLFRVMTTERPEIVIEGSRDGVHWRGEQVRLKPGGRARPPRH